MLVQKCPITTNFILIRRILVRPLPGIVSFVNECSFIVIDKSFSTFLLVLPGPVCCWVSRKSILFEEDKFASRFQNTCIGINEWVFSSRVIGL
jgi:hypothetical protein